MKIFISWSGDISHAVALAFNEWLPCVLQEVEPFLSSEGIHKGAPWFEAIGAQLEDTDFGILCLTPFNLEAPWILFEAGALSKKVGKARVVPLVLGLSPSELKPPLSNFNAATISKDDTLKLVRSVNEGRKDKPMADAQLSKVFEKWWPDLEAKLKQAEDKLTKVGAERTATAPLSRTVEDMLGELLELTRSLAQRQYAGFGLPPSSGAGAVSIRDAGPLAALLTQENFLRQVEQWRTAHNQARGMDFSGGGLLSPEKPVKEDGSPGAE